MNKIITFGEIILRLSTNIGERLYKTNQLTMHYGGAEANVSVSLANFGHDVYIVSKVPKNALGNAAKFQLESNGVHTDYLLKGGERLGTYYLETGVGERNAQVTYDRKYSSISKLVADEIDFDKIFEDATLFHVTGITPALSKDLADLTLLLLKKAKEKGVITSFDFNYRSKLWSQQEAASTFKQFLPYVDICFCGELDAIHFLGMDKLDESIDEAERLKRYYEEIQSLYPNIKYLSSTFREVISASMNRLQGNYYTNGVLYQSKVHQIDQIVDRVGAGDAFAAGILHGVLKGMEPEKTVSFATAGSALKHTILGDSNSFSEDEIMAFCEKESSKIIR